MNENQRTVTLPTIPKEVADAIEWCRELYDTADIIDRYHHGVYYGTHMQALRSIPFDTLLSALVNGYVVKKSAEELEREAHDIIREKYKQPAISLHARGFDAGMLFALNTLGIKIEGVNA